MEEKERVEEENITNVYTLESRAKGNMRRQLSSMRPSRFYHTRWPGDGELSLAQLVRFLVVEPAHPDSSPRFGTGARIFLDLFKDLTALCFQW